MHPGASVACRRVMACERPSSSPRPASCWGCGRRRGRRGVRARRSGGRDPREGCGLGYAGRIVHGGQQHAREPALDEHRDRRAGTNAPGSATDSSGPGGASRMARESGLSRGDFLHASLVGSQGHQGCAPRGVDERLRGRGGGPVYSPAGSPRVGRSFGGADRLRNAAIHDWRDGGPVLVGTGHAGRTS